MDVNTNQWKIQLKDEARKFGFLIDTHQADLLAQFAHELLVFSNQLNLIRIKNPYELIIKHFIDSFVPSRHIAENASVIDIGTGGGFPGLPLKIIKSSIDLTMIDGSRKKINFINYVIRTLNLKKAVAIQTRAELLVINGDDEKFDIAISRAVTALKQIISMALPLVKNNGVIIAMKGDKKATDVDIVNFKHFMSSSPDFVNKYKIDIHTETYRLPGHDNDRCIVIIRNQSQNVI